MLTKSGLESRSYLECGPALIPFVTPFKVRLSWDTYSATITPACGFISTLAGVAGILWREEQVGSGPFLQVSSGALGQLLWCGDEDPSKTSKVVCAGASFDCP